MTNHHWWVVKWKKSSLLINIFIQKILTAGNIEVTSLLVKREELKMHGAGNHQGDTDAALLLLSLLYYNYNFFILSFSLLLSFLLLGHRQGDPNTATEFFFQRSEKPLVEGKTCRGRLRSEKHGHRGLEQVFCETFPSSHSWLKCLFLFQNQKCFVKTWKMCLASKLCWHPS